MKGKNFFLQIPLFEGLPEENLSLLRKIAQEKRYPAKTLVFSEGDEATGFYVVISGRVKIFKVSASGKEQILHIFGPGEPFGEVAVFAGMNFPAYAQTLEESHLLYFPRKDFVRLIEQEPSLALNMLAVLSRRLRQFAAMIEALALKEVSERLAAYLLLLAERQGRELVELEINKGQLASLLGTTPETISRVFTRLAREGYVEMEGRRIHLRAKEALQELAAGLRRL
ncbi:Crp/Fnr family transcriptional regulator [Thermosulfuriphilus ammonigenes]|uniref:Crp/Fnr family transcriptional regulator n=1 Tax=Thermosulfuriphilus ammonigenes TaxID=1936021 RepID=A0A6G7PYX3_9BACT|nr:Crp/Fnr family transcriptional regulator [Thermosulfuriphilus ammonigenes]MBA2849062.1 CRP/FNR family transcriptional regulator [Thermosulfuriphilus ammonigenes]QIJ72746.1 Crp/Fnr family transcriptional regulator [Thermosulfuriphilus ammonigenes]